MNKFENQFGDDGGTPEKREKMVEAIKISTVFSDPKVLEKIADNLLSRGIISGFHIDHTLAGYVYGGQKVSEDQFSLEILLDTTSDQDKRDQIRDEIEKVIGEKWDVPAIEEEKVLINENLLGFIKRAETEHARYKREKKLKLTVAVTALLALSGLVGTFTKKHFDEKKTKAIATERLKTYGRLSDLREGIERKVALLDAQLTEERPLHTMPNDMAAETSYEETDEILKMVRDAEREMEKLSKMEEK